MRRLVPAVLVAVDLVCMPVARAQYTANFQTNIISGVTSNWTGNYLVGSNTFADVLLVQNSGVLSNRNSYLGYEVGSSNNAVAVTGAGSIWSNVLSLYVGYSGSGNCLTISNGGKVINMSGHPPGTGYLGYGSSSGNNSVLIANTDSEWNCSGLIVGRDGSGNSLVVSNGGRVTAGGDSYLGNLSGSNNLAVVTGPGSCWNSFGDLYVGNSGEASSLVVRDGGQVTNNFGNVGWSTGSNNVLVADVGSAWTNRSSLRIGYQGAGNSLVISNGGRVTSGGGVVGFQFGGDNNNVLVTGLGSGWNAGGQLTIGLNSSGNALAISDGGWVTNDNTYIGQQNVGSSNNKVVVTGSGSVWSNSSDLYIGYYGRSGNSLVISNGGRVFNRYGYISYQGLGGYNGVFVTGPYSAWNNSGDVYLGFSGAGNTLVISNEAQVISAGGYLGYSSTSSNNSALVTGSGSVWSNSGTLAVGVSGSGNSLIVSNGGLVDVSGNGAIGFNTTASRNSVLIAGTGTVCNVGGTIYVGENGSNNNLTVSDSGQLMGSFFIGGDFNNSTIPVGNRVLVTGGGLVRTTFASYVGYSSAGNSLVVSNGGQFVSGNSFGIIGERSSSSNNTVLVTGAGSVWSNQSTLYVGEFGSSNALMITDGGLVNNVNSYVGYSSATNNRVVVAGIGSVWSNRGIMTFNSRDCSLVVSNGGQLINLNDASFGRENILITGNGSVWNGQDVYLGDSGSLVISNIGKVLNRDSYIGRNFVDSNCTVRVTDNGFWQGRTLYAGYQGSSNSVLLAGGSVYATNLVIGALSTLCNNLVRLDTGNIAVTNSTGDAVLEVRRGAFILNGGALQVDRFVMTNSCAQFIRTGGTLIYSSAVLTTNLDADGDGMANGWEQAYGLDPLNAADANADSDGDGFTNLQEFQAGTDPTNSASAFRILSVVPTNNDMLVSWTAGGGRTNVVQSSTDLTDSYNNTSPNIILPGSGDVTTNYLDAGAATNAASRFYKIRSVP